MEGRSTDFFCHISNSLIFHGGDGFYYHLSNARANRRFAYLRCTRYRRSGPDKCPGTAKALMARKKLFHMNGHCHGSDVLFPHARALKKDVFNRVESGDQTPFNEILHAIRSKLRPPVPRSLGVLGACLMLPEYEYLTKCLHVPGSLFAGMCGSMSEQTLSLVFISPEMQLFMQTRSHVFADGTERKLFRKPKASQIFVVSAAWRCHALVMMRAIMLRRTQKAYEVLFDFMLTLMPDFAPISIKCDFEDAQINAWQTRFPNASVEGCLWHYDVAVFSYPKNKLGLYHVVKNEEEVASIIRSAGALPLLPTEDIEMGLHDLGLEAVEKGWMANLKYFFKYMETEWMPKIPVLSVVDSVHRTNNISESTNRAFNKEVKVSSPSCFSVLRAFVATNEKYTVDLHSLAANVKPGRGRKISALRNDKHIKCLTTDYLNGDITRLQFLHRASRRMQNVFNKVYK